MRWPTPACLAISATIAALAGRAASSHCPGAAVLLLAACIALAAANAAHAALAAARRTTAA